MSWFKRHLNWTIVLSWVAAWLFSFIFGWSWGWGPLEVEPVISSDFLGGWTSLIGLAGASLIILFVTGWTLGKKNRSGLNLLWYLFFPPIGAIILLSLKNKGEVVDIVEGKLITRPKRETD